MHHAGWLADVAMRAVVWRGVGSLMHGLSALAVLLVLVLAVAAYLAWRGRI